ncbi:transcriptional regulator [Sphaerisporangium melleum]|uniref:Transcriptional regulator n=1 Tax=Sphaerisporangium melleum TaxID=321316 RepID=A0A917R0I0_9ACTN|nr:helix-turn-helix transcriptional regulator [Sphaerisporangium melleum]GGK79821.1 transcriptional regulator [Sphaerisporangium melleum]GII72126.1 transcriptional regulator [Sphaerisporangium melleum]
MVHDQMDGLDDGRRRLGAELRRLRDLAGLSGRDLAQRVRISQSKVSRIESGAVVPSLPEVHDWAEAVHASSEARDLLATLTEAAHTDIRSWKTELRDRPHLQHEIGATESAARCSFTFQPTIVPGLLQTAEYARRIFSMFQVPYSKEEAAAALAARLDRQLLLYDESRSFHFLITEAALRWRPGPRAMLAAQLDRISSVSTLGNVSIGVLPIDCESRAPNSHAFTIYEPADEESDDFVTVETIHSRVKAYHPSDVELYRSRWSIYGESALSGDDARRFLGELIAEFRGDGR